MTPKFTYVPILKSKAGERWSLHNLRDETRGKVRPVIEIHGAGKKPLEIHLAKTLEQLHESWGSNRFYMDGIWLHGESGDARILDQLFTVARAYGLRPIPVVRPQFDTESIAIVRDIATLDGRGCLVRATPQAATDTRLLSSVGIALGKPRAKIDLLIDYSGRPMKLAVDVPAIAFLEDWRHFIAASGVFPQSVASLPLRSWENIQRSDWASWRAGIETGLAREPIFADYTTRAPGAPAGGGNPPVHLRYTRQTDWAVRVDGRLQAGDAPEMHKICGSLIAQPFFRGEMFSAGDMELTRVAEPDEGSGGPTQWVQWGISHHIESVINQLERHAF